MKRRYIIPFVSAIILLGACAHSPEKVAMEYWTKKAELNPACSDQVESRFRQDVGQDVKDARNRMTMFYPHLDQYRYDFSGLSAELTQHAEKVAQVRIRGRAVAEDPRGAFRDEAPVDEVVDLKMERGSWKIDGGWRMDRSVRSALNDLAGAQSRFLEKHRTYASDAVQLAPWFKAPDGMNVSILEADQTHWRAMAYFSGSRRAFVYDSKVGGLLSEPILMKP